MQYSKDLTNLIQKAKNLALEWSRPNVCLDILFYSIILSKGSVLTHLCLSLSIKKGDLRVLTELLLAKKKRSKNPSSRLSKDVKEIIKFAEELAVENKSDYCSVEHLLSSILFYPKKTTTFSMLDRDGDATERFQIQISKFMNNSLPPLGAEAEKISEEKLVVEKQSLEMFEPNKILDEFGENLNLKAARGDFDNLINYDPEKLDEIVISLLRKKKANVVLVGPAGTGKTAWCEMLAKLIVCGEAPDLLQDKVIYSVNLSSMVAGTEFRGMFERRLVGFINEAKKYDNIVLFFDELHTLVGAGGGSKNDLEASNILKPALANGDLSVIGATTNDEYDKKIKYDSALNRRFVKVNISEPSKFKMLQILPNLSKYYEDAHDVSFSDRFLEELVDKCDLYLPNRRYPDKAIDILDTVGAKAKMKYQSAPPYIKDAQRSLLDLSEKIFLGGGNDEGAIQKKLDEIRIACDKWERDYVDTPRVVEPDDLEAFFEKKKRLSLRACFENLRETLPNKKSFVEDVLRKTKKDSNFFLFFGSKHVGKSEVCQGFIELAKKNDIDVIKFSGLDFHVGELCDRILNVDAAIVVIDDFNEISLENLKFFRKILKDKKIERASGEVVDFSNTDFILTVDSKSEKTMGFDKKGGDEPDLDAETCKLICNAFSIPLK